MREFIMRGIAALCAAAVLPLAACSDPGYEVNDAHLYGDQIAVEVHYGMQSEETLGILLVASQRDDHIWDYYDETHVELTEDSVVLYGHVYGLAYAETKSDWCPPFRSSFVKTSELTRDSTTGLPAATIDDIQRGKLEAILVTRARGIGLSPKDGLPNKDSLRFRVRKIMSRSRID